MKSKMKIKMKIAGKLWGLSAILLFVSCAKGFDEFVWLLQSRLISSVAGSSI